MIGGTAGIGWFWWQQHQPRLPPGITWGNGRIEADEIDIDTKLAGRIAGLSVEEGAFVKAGQQVGRMDTSDLEASLSKDEAQVRQAQKTLEEARANVEQQKAQVRLAQQQLDRTQFFGAERLGHQRVVGSAQTAAGCRELELGGGGLQARPDGARARCG